MDTFILSHPDMDTFIFKNNVIELRIDVDSSYDDILEAYAAIELGISYESDSIKVDGGKFSVNVQDSEFQISFTIDIVLIKQAMCDACELIWNDTFSR